MSFKLGTRAVETVSVDLRDCINAAYPYNRSPNFVYERTDRYLMDLEANVLVLVILIVAVYLSHRTSPPAMNGGTQTAHRTRFTDERAWACPRGSDGPFTRFKKDYI